MATTATLMPTAPCEDTMDEFRFVSRAKLICGCGAFLSLILTYVFKDTNFVSLLLLVIGICLLLCVWLYYSRKKLQKDADTLIEEAVLERREAFVWDYLYERHPHDDSLYFFRWTLKTALERRKEEEKKEIRDQMRERGKLLFELAKQRKIRSSLCLRPLGLDFDVGGVTVNVSPVFQGVEVVDLIYTTETKALALGPFDEKGSPLSPERILGDKVVEELKSYFRPEWVV